MAGKMAFKELCKKVKRALSVKHTQRESSEVKQKVKWSVFFIYAPSSYLLNDLFLQESSKLTKKWSSNKGGDFFLSPHHLNTDIGIKNSPMDQHTAKKWKKKKSSEWNTKRNKPNHKHIEAIARRKSDSEESLFLMYCEILTKAKRSMNYANWPTSRKSRMEERGASSARKVEVNLTKSSFFLFLFFLSSNVTLILILYFSTIASAMKWEKR
jgi:hypothetical protein